jgi:hypothetical protein
MRTSDAHLDRINGFYHAALGGKYDADNLVSHTRGQKLQADRIGFIHKLHTG